MRFENHTILIPQDFLAAQRALDTCKSPIRTMRRMQRICYALPGIILILTGGTELWKLFTNVPTMMGRLGGALALIFAGLALILLPGSRTRARRQWSKYREKGVSMDYVFTDEHFTIGTAEIPYGNITDLLENAHSYILFANASPYIVHKDAFEDKSAGEFAAFLTQKTGLSIKPLS